MSTNKLMLFKFYHSQLLLSWKQS